MTLTLELIGLVCVLAYALRLLANRIALSAAKHRSLAGHARWSRRFAGWVPFYEYDEAAFFDADRASAAVIEQRRNAFASLAERCEVTSPKTLALTRRTEAAVSDMQFTSRYRVPFQFSSVVRKHLPTGTFYDHSSGVRLKDLDGNEVIDLSGSYGVNTFGYDFYKECIAKGSQAVSDLGPVLGVYHPVVAYNVQRLREISRLDEVSFHMSGTEAVMQAVRLARYHSGRRCLVRFCGAYHGWWGDVQPGVGNPIAARDTYTLAEMSDATLRVLRQRNDVACVLVNPLQALHPNQGAPSDSTLIGSGRTAKFEREAYTVWLQQLREICTRKKIALIFDEVFLGFRLANGGAQEYFGVRADLVTYGKTVGGGLPVGVLCGRASWMQRYRANRPVDICFARGTFNTQPYIMGAMHEFLQRLESPSMQALYENLEQTWNGRAAALNARLEAAALPIRVVNLSTVWTIVYQLPSRYNWMLQFYLRAHGVGLSWVGTGRLIFSLDFSQGDFDAVADRIMSAAGAMRAGGWWSTGTLRTNRSIQRQVIREMLQAKFFRSSGPLPVPLDLSRNK